MANEEKEEAKPLREQMMAAVPENVILKGTAINRQIIIDDRIIPILGAANLTGLTDVTFNWGYAGQGPVLTAAAVLLEFLDPQAATIFMNGFAIGVIRHITENNFEAHLKMKNIMSDLCKEGKLDEAKLKKNHYFFIKPLAFKED